MRRPTAEPESILTPVQTPPVRTAQDDDDEEPAEAPKPKVRRISVVVPQLPQQGIREAKDNAGNIYEYYTIEEALGEILDYVRTQKKKAQ